MPSNQVFAVHFRFYAFECDVIANAMTLDDDQMSEEMRIYNFDNIFIQFYFNCIQHRFL